MWFLLARLIKDCSPWLVCKAKWPKAHCRDCLQGAQELRRRQALCPPRGYLANRKEGRGIPDSLSQFLYLYRNLKGVMNYPHYCQAQAGVAVWHAGTSAEWPVRTERKTVICRTGAGETNRALGQVHKEAVSPGPGHPQASLSKGTHFRGRGL